MTNSDEKWIRRALELAERGRGHVEPNPLVGAVVVRDERIVGEGWHEKYGLAHAEVNALAAAGPAARGATLYVTLEPCCHHGKTPPCADAIRRAAVARVVAAVRDPNPLVAGGGAMALREANIRVDWGPLESEARRQNAPYFKLLTSHRPYVHAKWAMTLDGKIATRTGHSKWISNEAARRYVHELRGRMDAIVTGIGTVLADDPLLTARPAGSRMATRIVLDSACRIPADSRLAKSAPECPVIVVTAGKSAEGRVSTLESLGCQILNLEAANGRPSINALLDELGRRSMTNILLEAGSAVLGGFLDAKAIDEVHVVIAPLLAGGDQALTPVAGIGIDRLAEALVLADWRVRELEGNILINGWKGDSTGA